MAEMMAGVAGRQGNFGNYLFRSASSAFWMCCWNPEMTPHWRGQAEPLIYWFLHK